MFQFPNKSRREFISFLSLPLLGIATRGFAVGAEPKKQDFHAVWDAKEFILRQAAVDSGSSLMDIHIRNQQIFALGPNLSASAAIKTIDLAGRCVLPGLVEPHIHLDKALLESRRPNTAGTLAEAIRITGELKRQQVREDVLARAERIIKMAIIDLRTAIPAHFLLTTILNS